MNQSFDLPSPILLSLDSVDIDSSFSLSGEGNKSTESRLRRQQDAASSSGQHLRHLGH